MSFCIAADPSTGYAALVPQEGEVHLLGSVNRVI